LPHIGVEAGDWVRRAEEHLSAARPERALDGYRKALALEPDNPTLLMSCALVCLQLNRARDAEAITRRVLELEPGEMLQATAFAALMEALRSEGRYREGNRMGRRLLEEGRSNFARAIAYYEMARNLAEMEEDLDQALEFAQLSLEHSPEELRQFPLAAMGWVHFKRQEFDRAIELLSRSSELDASATTLTQLGLALLASGQDDRAREVMTRAREQGGQPRSLEQRMMECMLDSHALLERVRKPRG
jgi:tetratricopeptide (TPR) repeat protein